MEKEPQPQASNTESQPPRRLFKEKLVLASASPRRAEILRAVGWPFEALAVDIDETRREGEGAVAYVERLAREKAEAAAARIDDERLVLGADTVVVVDERVLGKPLDDAAARSMLRLLSGRWHEVLTGVALVSQGRQAHIVSEESEAHVIVAHQRTAVRFASVTETEVDWYVASREPLDKAGAYAIQGRAALFIEEIKGDYWNVVGLPIQLVYKLARRIQEASDFGVQP
ncbi:MAG TPA: Maf family protein [Pyrinomonadaceae bacterium]|jgi:septum formation protein|nr:Maf family protein [Pyrinomonadaceae bacterium]